MRVAAKPAPSEAFAADSAAAVVSPKPSATVSDWLPDSPVSEVSAVWTRSPPLPVLDVRAKAGLPATALATGLPVSRARSAAPPGSATSSSWSFPSDGSYSVSSWSFFPVRDSNRTSIIRTFRAGSVT